MRTLLHDAQLQHALKLSANGHLYAALEKFQDKLRSGEYGASGSLSLLYDEIGKIQIQQHDINAAEHSFTLAVAAADTLDNQAKCQIHLAMALHAQSNFDRAYRLLQEIENRAGAQLPNLRRGILFNNLATVQWATQFYRDAVTSLRKSLQYFEEADVVHYHSTLYNNLGICYIELRDYENAELCIQKALEASDAKEELMFSYTALSRMYLHQGDYEQSIEYARRSVPLFDEAYQTADPLLTAHLCRLYAELSFHIGDQRLAKQLMEKAELQVGLLGHWREFAEIRARLEEWTDGRVSPDRHLAGDTTLMKRFLLITEAWNTQEFIATRFSEFIDTRVKYATELAHQLQLSEEMKVNLVTAARLADYGLTAIGSDVTDRPDRSHTTWLQYIHHPELTVEMLGELQFCPDVNTLILRHHERCDGSGFPNQATDVPVSPNGEEAERDSLKAAERILQLSDAYAESVVLKRVSHTETMQHLRANAGAFDEDVLNALECLF
ncbi:HD domain-containing phosphohydrolase [Alicyclobacillus ferrooxydans]|uniref:Uncharacterized protein n=1 Tax=Alicyclobacillus ferrooxydans TaxID=471514 RepID=A0A0P9D003_9BACL|nr:HD domain-containing phosphohydrolase [Alicyclobacillus ferrooxydans]KPV42763.1 hypothetical protein AN477_15550 [Alicyclobacillus ferrooxydans]